MQAEGSNWEANVSKSYTGGSVQNTALVIKNKERPWSPVAQELTIHLLGPAELGPGRADIGARVRNCIVI